MLRNTTCICRFLTVVRAQRALVKGGRVSWGMRDVQGALQDETQEALIQRCQQTEKAKGWTGYLKDLFRAHGFMIEWDCGTGRTNMGGGSPLSMVVFLSFMAPILEAMENRIKMTLRLEVELLSYVDDILAFIPDPRERRNMD